MVAPGGGG